MSPRAPMTFSLSFQTPEPPFATLAEQGTTPEALPAHWGYAASPAQDLVLLKTRQSSLWVWTEHQTPLLKLCSCMHAPGHTPIQARNKLSLALFLVASLLGISTFLSDVRTRWLSGNESACQCRRRRRCGFDPWVGKISWSRKWQPTPGFLLGNPMDRGAWRTTVHGVTKSENERMHMRRKDSQETEQRRGEGSVRQTWCWAAVFNGLFSLVMLS